VVSKPSILRRSGEPLGPNPIEDDRPFPPILKPPPDPKQRGRRRKGEVGCRTYGRARENGGGGHGSPPSETVTSVTTVTALISLGFSVTL
jgi:hypothetical protein